MLSPGLRQKFQHPGGRWSAPLASMFSVRHSRSRTIGLTSPSVRMTAPAYGGLPACTFALYLPAIPPAAPATIALDRCRKRLLTDYRPVRSIHPHASCLAQQCRMPSQRARTILALASRPYLFGNSIQQGRAIWWHLGEMVNQPAT